MKDQSRPLHVIAREIRATWPDMYFGAVPYVEAMECLNWVDDKYGEDDGEIVVRTFLSNTRTWKGEDAARIKNELRVMVGMKPVKPRASTAKPTLDPKPTIAHAEKLAGRQVVKAAVVRAIFCPFTGVVLDMRRAVVIDTGTRAFVCTGAHWDSVKADIEAAVAGVNGSITVYDGRELFKR